jgi:hypothetical protein
VKTLISEENLRLQIESELLVKNADTGAIHYPERVVNSLNCHGFSKEAEAMTRKLMCDESITMQSFYAQLLTEFQIKERLTKYTAPEVGEERAESDEVFKEQMRRLFSQSRSQAISYLRRNIASAIKGRDGYQTDFQKAEDEFAEFNAAAKSARNKKTKVPVVPSLTSIREKHNVLIPNDNDLWNLFPEEIQESELAISQCKIPKKNEFLKRMLDEGMLPKTSVARTEGVYAKELVFLRGINLSQVAMSFFAHMSEGCPSTFRREGVTYDAEGNPVDPKSQG